MSEHQLEMPAIGHKIISYEDAKANGLLRYFNGVPCKRGHIAERYVSSNGCVECSHERNERRRNLVSLEEAIKHGRRTYFTGIPCRKGHVSERTVSGKRCVACERANWKASRERMKAARVQTSAPLTCVPAEAAKATASSPRGWFRRLSLWLTGQ